MKPDSLPGRLDDLEEELKALEKRLIDIQNRYEEKAGERQMLERVARRLRREGISLRQPVTWARICELKGWQVGRDGAHRVVKRSSPVLHILLHQGIFGAFCRIDRAYYPLS